jgi:CubicO group peptidase (beta-lactamase class C family)
MRLPADLQDPYARYPHARFVRAARRALRAGSGGRPYAYSNFGYGLLGYLLGQAAGTTYEALVATRICGPLGLPDTTFEVPGPTLDRKAQGHQRGRAVPDWHLGARGRGLVNRCRSVSMSKLTSRSRPLPGGGPGLARIRGAGFLFHRGVPR